ncbi:MAG: PLP-dependent aminotransferase family protein [Desulfobacter sp.]|nr:MAG: PLP-dependent aminotransferase family protein [Desulfobacter sp.]
MVSIQIDKKSDRPLYLQISERIAKAISDNELSPGDKLPTVAAFSKEIGVTQATVRRALEDLKEKGLTESYVGRGTFVSAPPEPKADAGSGRGAASGYARSGRAAWQLRRRVSKGLCDLMCAASRPGTIDFAKGVPDPGLMDKGLFAEMVGLAMKTDEAAYLPYGKLEGDPELRELIARRYKDSGVMVSPEQVLITQGSQQGASIAALDAAEHSRHVIIEAPGFQGVVDAFAGLGNSVSTITNLPGVDVAGQLAGAPSGRGAILSICPEFQNPTGEVMPDALRRQISDWAMEGDHLVLSDEIFQDLRLDGEGPASMMEILGPERTISISSLSKSLMPGLRVGWMIGSAQRIAEFTRIKRLMAQTGPPLMQGVAAAFLRSGAFDAHLEKTKEIYARRRAVMLGALDDLMPKGVTWGNPGGGFYVWVTLPNGYSSVALLISLLDKGVNMVPGPVFDMDQRFVNAFRLGWAWTGEEEILKGLELMADAVKDLLAGGPGDAGLSGLGQF